MKAFKDKISQLMDTNDALSGAIRAMRKEKVTTHHNTNSDRGSDDNDDDDGVDNRLPMLFKS